MASATRAPRLIWAGCKVPFEWLLSDGYAQIVTFAKSGNLPSGVA